jgi:hypothetical protein
VTLPWWWTYPTKCGNGHAWGPGKVIVSWLPCQCGPARAAQPRGSGHRTISCRTPGCEYACYDPPHEPKPGDDFPGQLAEGGGQRRRRPCAQARPGDWGTAAGGIGQARLALRMAC